MIEKTIYFFIHIYYFILFVIRLNNWTIEKICNKYRKHRKSYVSFQLSILAALKIFAISLSKYFLGCFFRFAKQFVKLELLYIVGSALESWNLKVRKRSTLATQFMAIPVVEFSREGYKIRKVIGWKSSVVKWNHWILRIGVMRRCQKCQNFTFNINFLR